MNNQASKNKSKIEVKLQPNQAKAKAELKIKLTIGAKSKLMIQAQLILKLEQLQLILENSIDRIKNWFFSPKMNIRYEKRMSKETMFDEGVFEEAEIKLELH